MTRSSPKNRLTSTYGIILSIVIIAILLTGGLLSCAPAAPAPTTPSTPSTPTTPTSTEPIKIGCILPESGTAAFLGTQCENGMKLAWEEMNYQAAGRKIELIFEDETEVPDVALTKARKLVEKDNVPILFGPFLRHTEAAVDQYLLDQGNAWVPIFSPGGADLGKFAKIRYAVAGHFSEQSITVPFAEYAYQKMGWRKVICLASDYLWGHACLDSFQKGFERAGGTMVEKIFVPLGTMDMAPYVDKVKAKASQADFVWDFCIVSDSVRLQRTLVEQGIKLPRYSNGEGVTSPGLLQETGLAAVGAYGIFTWVQETGEKFPAAKKFVDSYLQKYNIGADYFALCGYQGAKVIKKAIEDLNGDVSNNEKFLQALLAVRLPKEDNPTRDGEFYFDKELPFPILDGYVCLVKEVNGKPKLEIIDVIKDIPPKLLPGIYTE